MKLAKSILTPFLLSLLLGASAWADGAKLSFASGEVLAGKAGAETAAQAGQPLAAGDVVRTGKGAAAIVALADGSQVKLNPETELQVASLGGAGTELALKAGAVFSKVQKQQGKSRFTIRTKTATMGVRGTQFYTAYGRRSGVGSDVWMCVHEGKVEVESAQDRKKVLVNPGEGVFVPVGKGVTPPRKYGWTENLNWNMDPAAGELIDRTQIDYQDLLKQDYD